MATILRAADLQGAAQPRQPVVGPLALFGHPHQAVGNQARERQGGQGNGRPLDNRPGLLGEPNPRPGGCRASVPADAKEKTRLASQIRRAEALALHDELTGGSRLPAHQGDGHDRAMLQIQIRLGRHYVFDRPLELVHSFPRTILLDQPTPFLLYKKVSRRPVNPLEELAVATILLFPHVVAPPLVQKLRRRDNRVDQAVERILIRRQLGPHVIERFLIRRQQTATERVRKHLSA